MLWTEHFHSKLMIYFDEMRFSSVAEGFFSCNSQDGASCSINGSSRFITTIEIWIQQQVSYYLVANLTNSLSTGTCNA